MNGASLTVRHRSGEILEALAALRAATVDTYRAMDAIGQEVEERVRLCFRDSRDPYGNEWAPLHYRVGQPLMDTRVLFNSITHRTDKASVQIGTNIEYAGPHQFGAARGSLGSTHRGTPIPWGNVPARPFLPTEDIPDDWEDSVLDLLRGHFLTVPGMSS